MNRKLKCFISLALFTGSLIFPVSVLSANKHFPATPVSPKNYEDLAGINPVTDCSALQQTDLTSIAGEGSQVLKATLDENRKVCIVTGRLAPQIGFEVRLPTENWRQRSLQIGCGGLCGRISDEIGAADGCPHITDGSFVTSATDMGHTVADGSFGKDSRLRTDFAYRSVHLTAQATRALITAFYGQNARYSYFTGCSDGGREALMAAQRYPDDFDGIIAGAAAMNFQTQNGVYHPWLAQINTDNDGNHILLADKLTLIHKAVVSQCDSLDGDKDGLISNPLSCSPDLQNLLCPSAQSDTSQCLTAQELDVLNKIYQGPKDPESGLSLLAGGPLPGAELAWKGIFIPESKKGPLFSTKIGQDANDVLFKKEDTPEKFDLRRIKFDASYFDKLSKLHRFYDSTNPDLHAFYQRGGKLILWHGLADQHISPLNTINYHLAVQKTMGKTVTSQFERLYLLPGVYHCGGGEGPDSIDLLSPVMAWVEKNIPPHEILTVQRNNNEAGTFGQPTSLIVGNKSQSSEHEGKESSVVQVRPVYPYPEVAVYNGHGDRNIPENYHPVIFDKMDNLTQWLGDKFFSPYEFLNSSD
ncbi:tannase/feruloyl esterase family alpha/beta hydrolase [Escherichia coli]|uniref:tannase/feruloyl esterase family alpha/beta hydrolase n=1 Tax=Escherichia coli TaxID=562 RepID=UPI0015D922A3|nr:tannase/feruloyl esterase family alpha/beta hydrolase [Escherichia coli]EHY3138009.1 tannase/feruloyl esterase family alpha/beta hydrolase [Escherichia coli]MCI5377140.1 tannase/feruloyl esterase family alpha/beta hydrolase [Escherichia coli]